MIEEIFSVMEGIIAGIFVWKVAIPAFLELAKTETGYWAYFGLICFLLVVVVGEYASYKKNGVTWIVSIILGTYVERR